MRLAELIKHGVTVGVATATPATMATHGEQLAASVATVAIVAVAKAENSISQEAWDERAAIIAANGIPDAWAEGYATLCTMPCPAAFVPERWQQLVDDGGYFLDRWGRQAALLGWRAVDVFGVDPVRPETVYRSMGLVSLLAGRAVCAITTDAARIDCGNGITQSFRRRATSCGAVSLWNLERG
ncbi:MAG: hypothetical protein WBK91_06015 [Alphaproteobacteria bacterium]